MDRLEVLAQPKEIIKEGLGEYFIYTIEGTETIPNGWSKRMRSLRGTTVPMKIEYRYREPEYGNQLVRMYLLTNDEASNLGTTPLPDGTVRVFGDNIWMHVRGANLYRRVGDGNVRIDVKSTVAGWDDHTDYAQRVRNYTSRPIVVQVRRAFRGHVIFRGELEAKNHDYRTVEYTATVAAGEKADLKYEIHQLQGRNRKQDNVTVQR